MKYLKGLLYIFKYILHALCAKNTNGHGIHSPFLYSLVQNVIYDKHPFYAFDEIEKIRTELLENKSIISIKDYGAGNKTENRVSNIAKKSLKDVKWSQMLFRLVNFAKPKNVLEMGTSLGVTTAYLASADSEIRCVTMEGAPEIAKIANENFRKLNLKNIRLVEGNIDETLAETLQDFDTLDIVFFDANHRKNALTNYFEECVKKINNHTVFVFDDIHWSADMERFWKWVKKHEKPTATLDLFELGMVFFKEELPKKNFRLKR